ncbi:MAG: type II toxin-antitoxin system Phd/YefM family antitoxin [Tyzzerella sp.]|nr:type II toxin-antitoxin system Phd/YefM family antitoxin [Tyzzerella sp.]
MQIRPISDLRNKFTDIEKTVSSGEPVYLTKNGYGTMVVLSLDSYSHLIERIEKALDEADRLAEETSVRYTHEEVFGKIRDKIK